MTQAAEEDKSLIESEEPDAQQENASEKPQSPEAALVEALRKFIHRESGEQEEKQASGKISVFQAVVLLVVVLDIVLFYDQFKNWFDHPLFEFALKVLPWLLGATAFAYSDKVREWILAKCKSKIVAAIAILVALPMLIIRQPIFSLIVHVKDQVSLEPYKDESVSDKDQNQNKEKQPLVRISPSSDDPGNYRVTPPDLRSSYRIVVKDDTSKNSMPFKPYIGWRRVVMGTLEGIFGHPSLQLDPLYQIATTSTGEAHASIEGLFGNEFLDRRLLDELDCKVKPGSKNKAIFCTVRDMDTLSLPPGEYKLTLSTDKCTVSIPSLKLSRNGWSVLNPIPKGVNENKEINFDSLCS